MSHFKSAVLILVDGLRPDALQQAHAPVMQRLLTQGASTLRGRTVMPSVTLPVHTSLFFSVDPQRHGIADNKWRPLTPPIPSLFDVVNAAGLKSLAYYNWEELRDLGKPGSLAESHVIRYDKARGDESDQVLFAMAAQRLAAKDFGLAFLYYGSLDFTGHEQGWMTEAYMRRIADADRAIAGVLPALPDDCLVVFTSDHGGHDMKHGTDSDQDMLVPVILRADGITPGSPLADPVNIIDLAPTILRWLNLPAPAEWTGRPLI